MPSSLPRKTKKSWDFHCSNLPISAFIRPRNIFSSSLALFSYKVGIAPWKKLKVLKRKVAHRTNLRNNHPKTEPLTWKGTMLKEIHDDNIPRIHTKSISIILKSYYYSGNIFRFRGKKNKNNSKEEFHVGFSHWDLVMPERKFLVEKFHAQLSEQIVDSWSSFLAWCDLGFRDLGCFNARKLSSEFLWFWLSWSTKKAWVDGNQPEENWLFSLSKIQCLQICWWLSCGVSSQ